MNEHLLCLCSCPDRETADSIAETLVERGLAACVNVQAGSESVYRWQGRVERSREHLLLIKTRTRAWPPLKQTLRALHPYELPEIIAVPISHGLAEYLAWIDENVTGADTAPPDNEKPT